MKRYIIEESAWQETCNGIRCCECSMSDGTGACRLGEYIQKQPTCKEIQRGVWIDHSDEGYVECPFCDHATNCDDNIEELHFCFYCGASMSAYDRQVTCKLEKEGEKNESDHL